MRSATHRLLGAVLAGGRGRRFGGDKTAAAVAGVPMLRRAHRTLEAVCDEVVVVSSREDTPEGPWRVVPDLRSRRGPLAGIEAALAEACRLWPDADSGVLVLAADLPLVGPEVVARLVEAYQGAGEGTRAVAAAAPGAESGSPDGSAPGYEPLCAIYDVGCLESVARLLDDDRSAARELFRAVSGEAVHVGDEATFLNVNTTEDAERASAILGGEGG